MLPYCAYFTSVSVPAAGILNIRQTLELSPRYSVRKKSIGYSAPLDDRYWAISSLLSTSLW